MNKFLKNKWQIIFSFLFLISILPFFYPSTKEPNAYVLKREKFNPSLSNCNSIDKAISYTDSVYASDNTAIQFDTAKYVHVISRFTKDRFYHGLSNYDISDNWIAYLSGKLLWSHLSAIVIPDDILKHPQGLCSQQTIIFMELLKRKGIRVRSVGLGYKEGPGHFISEAYYQGAWRLYDVSKEPEWKKISNKHLSMDYYLTHKDSLFRVYENKMTLNVFNRLIEKVSYGEINEFPAKNMLIFQRITKVFTYILPLFFLLLLFLIPRKKG